MNALDALNAAAELLKRAGFRYTSMKSEAYYYALPGDDCLIRIASSRASRSPSKQRAVRGGYSLVDVQQKVADGIGWYHLRSRGILPYTGRQPRLMAELS